MIVEGLRTHRVCQCMLGCLAYFIQMMPPLSRYSGTRRGAAADLRLGRDLRTLHSLFTLTQSRWWEPPLPPPTPPANTSLPPLPDGPSLVLSLFTFIYKCIYFSSALRVTVFNIIGETWLLPLNAEITGAFFLSSPPLHFSCVAPRGRNIFISPCAPSFKTFTPAVWKIFLIFLPHGVEKSP